MMKKESINFGIVGFLLALLLPAACSFEIPEKVHVTGSPEFVASLGSRSIDPIKLTDHFGPDEIKDIFDSENSEFQVAEYIYVDPADSYKNTLTYLLSYTPEAIEFELDTFDLTSTNTNPFTIVSVTVPSLDNTYTVADTFPIPENDYSIPSAGIGYTLIPSNDTTGFEEATIGTGYIELSLGSHADIFSGVQIELKDGDVSQGRISQSAGKYSLENKKIKPGTQIYFYGTISGTGSSDTGALKAKITVSEISSITIEAPSGTQEFSPQDFSVDIEEPKKWAKWIKFEEIGVKIEGPADTQVHGGNVEVTITNASGETVLKDLGGTTLLTITNSFPLDNIYKEGGEKIVSEAMMDIEAASGDTATITVQSKVTADYFTVTGAFAPGATVPIQITPTAIVEWKSVSVNPNTMMGSADTDQIFPALSDDPIDFGEFFDSLTDALGEGEIELNQAAVYLYINYSDTIDENTPVIGLKLTAIYDSKSIPGVNDVLTTGTNGIAKPLPGSTAKAPVFTEEPPGEGAYVYDALLEAQYAPIEIQGIINTKPSDFRIKAEVDLPNDYVTIERGTDYVVRISPQIVIKIPLSFTIAVANNENALNLNKLAYDDEEEGEKDLFKRDSAEDLEDLFEFLDNLNLHMDYENNLTNGAASLELRLKPSGKKLEAALSPGVGSMDFTLSHEDVTYPFNPDIMLVFPGSGLLDLKRQSADADSFKINSASVTVGMTVDKTF
jgi:hypothetical protein